MSRPILSLILSALAGLAIGLAGPVPLVGQEHDEHAHDPDEAHARNLGHAHGGFPQFVDVFFTHHAYLERKLHPRVAATLADAENEYEESGELAWQFTRWLGGELEVPIVQTDPKVGDGAAGLGDIEVAPLVALWQSAERLAIVSVRSGFVLPTGDEDEGLGADGWTWEPGFLAWKGYGADRRGALQEEVTYERSMPTRAPTRRSSSTTSPGPTGYPQTGSRSPR